MEHLLSEVARVSVRPELLNSPLLKGRRRAELRREAIKDYIRRKPYGKRIKMTEIKDVGHFGTGANAFAFMKRMVEEGSIVKHELSPRRFFYTVPGEVKVTKPAINMAPPTEAVPTPEDIAHEDDDRYRRSATRKDEPKPQSSLQQKAARYLYHYGPEADNVRDFVKWLDSLEDL